MSDESAVEIVEEVQSLFISNYFVYGLSALVVYDYVITLQGEVELVWKRRFTGASVLFILNRYLLLSYTSMQFIFPSTDKGCTIWEDFYNVVVSIQIIILAVFSALRVYAVSRRRISLPVTVLLLGFIPVGANIYYFSTITMFHLQDSVYGSICGQQTTVLPSINLMLLLLSRIPLIILDLIVIITLWAVLPHVRTSSRRSLPEIVLKDGSLYFVALLIMDVAQMVVDNTPAFAMGSSPTGQILSYLPPVFISRCLLNIRQTDADGTETSVVSTAVTVWDAVSPYGDCDCENCLDIPHAVVPTTDRS